jgi:hypothetical protein
MLNIGSAVPIGVITVPGISPYGLKVKSKSPAAANADAVVKTKSGGSKIRHSVLIIIVAIFCRNLTEITKIYSSTAERK